MPELPKGRVFAGPPGWTDIGKTDGTGFEFATALPVADLEPTPPQWPKFPVTLSITVDYSHAAAAFRRLIRQMIRLVRAAKRMRHEKNHPGSHSHCRLCHPEQAPRPLKVNGREYRRRQLARQRRRRHGR